MTSKVKNFGRSYLVINAILEWMTAQWPRGALPVWDLERVERWFGEEWESRHDWPANQVSYSDGACAD